MKLSCRFVGGKLPREESGEAETELEGLDVPTVVQEEAASVTVEEGTDLYGVNAGDVHIVGVQGKFGWRKVLAAPVIDLVYSKEDRCGKITL